MNAIFSRRAIPWWIAAIFAFGFFAVLLTKGNTHDRLVDGVVQDESGRRVLYWADPMIALGPPHNYKSNKPGIAPDCQMKLVPVYADPGGTPTDGSIAISPERQQLAGVKLAKAEPRDLSHTVRAAGTVAIDERLRSRVQTKFDGTIEHVYVDTPGARVRRGEPLVSIYSPDLINTQQDLLLAAKSGTEFASTLENAARQRLLLWDMTASEIDGVIRSGQPRRSITIIAPADGVVLARNAILGSQVGPGQALYELADLRQVWVLAGVYESELPFIRIGTPAAVTLASAPGKTWNGTVSFIDPVVDEKTRTTNVRIELPNSDGMLKPDMYADVTLQSPIGSVLAVPESAILQTGTRAVAFVDGGNGRFAPREVVVGAQSGGFLQIRAGLKPGDVVAVEANFLLDSEARLRATDGAHR